MSKFKVQNGFKHLNLKLVSGLVFRIYDFSVIIMGAEIVIAMSEAQINSVLVRRMNRDTTLCLRSPIAGRSKSGCRCGIPVPWAQLLSVECRCRSPW